jgi:predicted transcriptional regulator
MDYSLLGFIKASKHREEIVKILGEEILTPTEISRALDLHTSQVSRNLAELVEKGLARILTPNLRKGKVYTLTDVGKECLDVLKGDNREKRH